MTTDERSPGSPGYIQRVRQDTQRYARDLLKELEALRLVVASLESEKASLVRQLDDIRASASRRDHTDIELRLREMQRERQRFAEEFVEVERQNNNLASLYVASYRLHGTRDRGEILLIIQEIVANLVGCEEMAVFEREGDELRIVASNGVDPSTMSPLHLGDEGIGRIVATGMPWTIDRPTDPGPRAGDSLTACIPLKLDGQISGAIVLFRLLPQKSGLESVDHELLDLLATHAAMALYCSGLHSRLSPPPHP